MQYPTPQKYNPKRREKIVTKFSKLQKRLRILRVILACLEVLCFIKFPFPKLNNFPDNIKFSSGNKFSL